jgi:uncharacterized protein (TIGR02147 family)
MIDLFSYTDYCAYLRDFFDVKKKEGAYSFQRMAEMAGFNNRGFMYNIIKGNKALSKSNCFKLSQALGHSLLEADYFENLVACNRAQSPEERKYFFERMELARGTRNRQIIMAPPGGGETAEFFKKIAFDVSV